MNIDDRCRAASPVGGICSLAKDHAGKHSAVHEGGDRWEWPHAPSERETPPNPKRGKMVGTLLTGEVAEKVRRMLDENTPVEEAMRLEREIADDELSQKASRVISEMCQGDRWRMCIPVHPDDSDVVLGTLVRRFNEVRAEASRQRAYIDEADRTLLSQVASIARLTMSTRRERQALIEPVAKAIYDAMRDHDPEGKQRPWVDGGNSLKQDEARSRARSALASSPTETPT